jgi:transposase
MKTTVKTPNVTVLVCKHCETVWNRDVNASKNMLNIATAIWKNLGRPVQYKSTESPQSTGFLLREVKISTVSYSYTHSSFDFKF